MALCKLYAPCTIVFGILFLLAGCGNNKENDIDVPPNILNVEAFAKVITSFALAESASNNNVLKVPYNKSDTVYAFNPLIEHHVRQSQYDSTVVFYTRNPSLYKKVYENVLASLTQLQNSRMGVKKTAGSK